MTLKTHRTKTTSCLNCGAACSAATAYPGQHAAPTPGNLTICAYCGHLMAFADDLSFRPLTDAEIVEAAGDKRILHFQKARAALRR